MRIPFVLSSARPRLEPLDGRPLLVHVVVNIESWPFDRPAARTLLPPPHGEARVPDVPNYSWVEYGLRCGMPRLFRELDGLPVSAFMNGAVVEDYPTLAEAVGAAGWEIVGHGHRQRSLAADDEDEVVAESLAVLERFYGTRPRGWMGPGLQETFDTPEVLVRNGIQYGFDWVLDDLPCWMRTNEGPLLNVPYSLELNDSVLFAVERRPSEDLAKRVSDTLDAFDAELQDNPRVLTLGLHPHLIGVPHRIGYLAAILEQLRERPDALFVTGQRIYDWYTQADPAPDHEMEPIRGEPAEEAR